MKTCTTEIKTDSVCSLVKTTYEHGAIKYQFKSGEEFLAINGQKKFDNALPIQHGFGAVAIRRTIRKTVAVE